MLVDGFVVLLCVCQGIVSEKVWGFLCGHTPWAEFGWVTLFKKSSPVWSWNIQKNYTNSQTLLLAVIVPHFSCKARDTSAAVTLLQTDLFAPVSVQRLQVHGQLLRHDWVLLIYSFFHHPAGLRLLGIGRNQYIDLMNQCRSSKVRHVSNIAFLNYHF